MKNKIYESLLLIFPLMIWFIIDCSAQSLGLNNPTPDPSSILDAVATDRGILIPRMTTAQRNAIVSPANGLQIINTTTACLELYWGGVWNSLGCACVGAPAAPTATAATGLLATQFTANWIAASGATAYYLDVATDAAFSSMVTGFNNLNVSNVTGYNVTGLTCNTTYYYRVRGSNNCGTGVNSSTITAVTAAASGPVAIAASGVQQTQFDANWGSVGGASTYYLDVATDAGFTAFVTGYNNLNVGLVITITVTGLTCGTTYYYRVRAGTSCGASSSSNTISQVTTSSPSAPVATSGSGLLQTQFTANWGAVAGATTYYLDVAIDAGFVTFVPGFSGLSVGAVTFYNVSGLACNTSYYYRLRASSGCGASGNSNTITVTTCACTPTSTAATDVTAGAFSANWAAAGGASSYYIDVATDNGFVSILPAYNNLNVGNVTTYSITGLTCNTTYYYRIRTGSTCAASPNSSTITVTTLSTFAATATAATAIAQTQFTANWGSVAGATSYILDVATDAGFVSMVAGYNGLNVGNVINYTVAPLTCNTIYYYRVRVVNSCGTSGNSNTVIPTTCVCTPTANAASSITSYGFAANWSAVVSATIYYLDVATDNGFTSILPSYNNLNVGNVTTYNVTGLVCNTAYYYRLRASSACGTSVSSNTINPTTLSTTAPTANAATGITGTSFSANWTAQSGATGYYIDVATSAAFGGTILPAYSNLSVGAVTTYSVTGLTCGTTTYYYQVRAINACGTSANSNAITVTMAPIYSIAITLTNAQATATGTNFQQKITVNSSTYAAYEHAGLQNVEFTTGSFGTGTQLQAWIESGISTASAATVYWVNLGSNSIAGSGGTLTIYMNFMPTNIMSSAGPTGCEPNTFTSTYGDLDNGANVFTFYDNFTGASLSANWVKGTGTKGSVTVSNGVTIVSNGSSQTVMQSVNPIITQNLIAESSCKVTSAVTGGNNLGIGIVDANQNITTQGYFNFFAGASFNTYYRNNNTWNNQLTGYVAYANATYYILGIARSGTSVTPQVNYTNYTTGAAGFAAGASLYVMMNRLWIEATGDVGTILYQWFRTRAYPPTNTMPTYPAFPAITCQ